MSGPRALYAFQPVDSTEPSFNSTLGASGLYALQSTLRFWNSPSGRAVRISSKAADDFSITVGSSGIVATSSGGILVLGGTVELFFIRPVVSHISYSASTNVEFNVTLGYGQ